MLYQLDFIKGKLCCPHCSIVDIDSGALFILKSIAREYHKKYGEHLYVTSGGRCPICNKAVGGKPRSAHKVVIRIGKRGKAFDISIKNNQKRYTILKVLFEIGVKRIGIGKTFIHWDVGLEANGYPSERAWLYL